MVPERLGEARVLRRKTVAAGSRLRRDEGQRRAKDSANRAVEIVPPFQLGDSGRIARLGAATENGDDAPPSSEIEGIVRPRLLNSPWLPVTRPPARCPCDAEPRMKAASTQTAASSSE